MKEVWKAVVGYEKHYLVSSTGRVKRKWRKILKTRVNKFGYEQVCLCVGNEKKLLSVHRLVAKAFISNPGNKPEVNHIDGNKANNSVENLEWMTKSENAIHAHDIGLYAKTGENHPSAVLTEKQVLEIREKYSTGETSQRKLAREYGVAKNSVSNILNGRAWRHTI